jgi:hypothetical protein
LHYEKTSIQISRQDQQNSFTKYGKEAGRYEQGSKMANGIDWLAILCNEKQS